MFQVSSVRALLLNSSYEPMQIVGWQKAMILFFQGKVEVIEYHPFFARTICATFQLPSILRLKKYVRPGNRDRVRFCRENVYIRDNFTCQYCGQQFSSSVLTLDHVVPASHNGQKSWTNVVTACRSCNQRKANRTPHQARMPLKTVPQMPTWLPTLQYKFDTEGVPSSWLDYLLMRNAG